MNKCKVLYIGNDLSSNSKYNSTMETLSNLLKSEGYIIYKSSNKINKLLRLINMCYAVYKYRNIVDYILIDTFSTTNFYYAFLTSKISSFFKIKYIPILHGGNLPQRIDKSPKMSTSIFEKSYINVAPSLYLKLAFEKRNYESILIPNVIEIEAYTYKKRTVLKPKLLFVRSFAEIYNPMMAIDVLFYLKKKYNVAPQNNLLVLSQTNQKIRHEI